MLERSLACVEAGEMERVVHHGSFAEYRITRGLVEREQGLAKTLYIPSFNAPLSDAAWLLPQVRDKFEGEKVHLVVADGPDGYFYDLHYPGYMWAETPNLGVRWGLR